MKNKVNVTTVAYHVGNVDIRRNMKGKIRGYCNLCGRYVNSFWFDPDSAYARGIDNDARSHNRLSHR